MTDKNFKPTQGQEGSLEDERVFDGEMSSEQTRFSWEKPLFESNQTTSHHAPPVITPATTQRKWYKKPIILVALAFVAVMLLLVSLLALVTPNTDQLLPLDPSPTPISNQMSDPLKQKILELRKELQAADPTRQDYPFPPVDMQLELAPQ